MRKIFRYLTTGEWLLMFTGFAFIVLQVWLDLSIPGYMSEITTILQTPGSGVSDILAPGSIMLLCALGSFTGSVIVGFLASRIGASFSQRIRSLLFNKVESFSMEEINRFSTSSLITRSTNDITQIQVFVTMGLQLIVKAPIMAIWAIIKITGKGSQWMLATAVAVGIVVATITFLMIFVIPTFKKMQSLTDNITRVARENLTGLRVVRAYNAEDYQENKFESANTELTDAQLFTNRSLAVMIPMITMIMCGLPLAIYWIGAYMIEAAGASDKLVIFSDMVVFSQYAMLIIMSFMMLIFIFILYPRASVSSKRIIEVLDTPLSISDGTVTQGLPGVTGQVAFKNVCFKYPDSSGYVIENISFTVDKGETLAIIGATGSGKSTIVNLIPRFFDVSSGEILIDGINVKEYNLEALYNKLGYVPQRAVLFKGTVDSNIAYGKNRRTSYDLDEVKKAVSISQSTEFVEKMSGQYQADIAQGGTNVSGGQKQRLSIARAVYRKPDVYIFDDSFSALDYKTDRVLRSELKKQTAGVTTILVAQRIGTILDADRIIVLDHGKIVGTGKHSELLKTCEVYKEIAASQLSESELS